MSGFDIAAGGAISTNGSTKQEERKLVIKGQGNRDWRKETEKRKRGRDLLPDEVRAQKEGRGVREDDGVERVNAGVEGFGLSFVAKVEASGESQDDVKSRDKAKGEGKGEGEGDRKVLSADEEALAALTGDGKRRSDLVLPAAGSGEVDDGTIAGRAAGLGMNEDDLFRSDVASRPESASLDDYAAVPIEEFGAALLRGMGWKEGDVVGKRKDQASKTRVVERRPALLGIGAKEVPGGTGTGGDNELGAWGKALKGKRKDKTYSPVVLRNARTGEMLTEDELKAKKEEERKRDLEGVNGDWRERGDESKAVRKQKERVGSRERRRHSPTRNGSRGSDHRRRERSFSTERKHRWQRGDDDGDDLPVRDQRDGDRRQRHYHDDDDYDRKESRHRRSGREDDSRSSRHGHGRKEVDGYDDTRRRRRHEEH